MEDLIISLLIRVSSSRLLSSINHENYDINCELFFFLMPFLTIYLFLTCLDLLKVVTFIFDLIDRYWKILLLHFLIHVFPLSLSKHQP